MQPYSAVVLGSTGNVGRQIVNLLAASPAVRQVVMNRRQTAEFKRMPKVREVVVPDMDKLAEGVDFRILWEWNACGGGNPCAPANVVLSHSPMTRKP
jgi:aspartate-semialdehyde dehydrogenase